MGKDGDKGKIGADESLLDGKKSSFTDSVTKF